MADCLFCKIAQKELPSEVVYEDDDFLAFKDIHPKALVHVLVIPKKHILSTLDEAETQHQELLGRLFLTVAQIAKQLGVAGKGYKALVNVKEYGGQSVSHLHVHIIGGENLRWKV